MILRTSIFLVVIKIGLCEGAPWEQCLPCKCSLIDSYKTASCAHHGLFDIPNNFSDEIQFIQLSYNNLTHYKQTFDNVGLVNLQRIFFNDCQLSALLTNTFQKVSHLFELDLSNNHLVTIPENIFADNLLLGTIRINNNLLEKLPMNLFKGLQKLNVIELKQNKFVYMNDKIILPSRSINNIDLDGNPWNCDCSLKNFVMKIKVIYPNADATCYEPVIHKNKIWREIENNDFACIPKISNYSETRTSNSHILVIELSADPEPDPPTWTFQDKIIFNKTKYEMEKSYGDNYTYSYILTIKDLDSNDMGKYKFSARNNGGETVKDFKVDGIYNDKMKEQFLLSMGSLSVMVTLIVFCTIIIIVMAVITVYVCRSKKVQSLNELEQDDKESSIVMINPIQKPPRRERPISEQSEDNDSVFGEVKSTKGFLNNQAHMPRHVYDNYTAPNSRAPTPNLIPLDRRSITSDMGYLTIPRKRRASLYSVPDNVSYATPLYDNLGIRSTALGNSNLSLNKLGETKRSPAYASSPILNQHKLGLDMVHRIPPRPLPKPKHAALGIPLMECDEEFGTEV